MGGKGEKYAEATKLRRYNQEASKADIHILFPFTQPFSCWHRQLVKCWSFFVSLVYALKAKNHESVEMSCLRHRT